MKVKEVIKRPDYVRFCFDVTVETSYGIQITVEASGVYTKISEPLLSNYAYISVEECEWGKITFAGEEMEYDGLEELFNKLFKKDFAQFRREVDSKAEYAIQKSYREWVGNAPKSDIKRVLAEMAGNSAFYTTSTGECIHTTWEIHELASTLAGKNTRQKFVENFIGDNLPHVRPDGTSCVWGITLSDLVKLTS